MPKDYKMDAEPGHIAGEMKQPEQALPSIPVQPVPTAVTWQFLPRGTRLEQGMITMDLIALQFSTATGAQVYFLDEALAKKMIAALTEMTNQIVVAPGSLAGMLAAQAARRFGDKQ